MVDCRRKVVVDCRLRGWLRGRFRGRFRGRSGDWLRLADSANVTEEGVRKVNVVFRSFGGVISKAAERNTPPLEEVAELTPTEAELCLRIWIKFGI